jgi:hypothetical protein
LSNTSGCCRHLAAAFELLLQRGKDRREAPVGRRFLEAFQGAQYRDAGLQQRGHLAAVQDQVEQRDLLAEQAAVQHAGFGRVGRRARLRAHQRQALRGKRFGQRAGIGDLERAFDLLAGGAAREVDELRQVAP